MKTCICPKCKQSLDCKRYKKYQIDSDDIYYPPFMPSKFIDKELSRFNQVECPHCGHNFKSQKIKLLGVFNADSFRWLIYCMLALFLIAVGFIIKDSL